MSRKFFTQKHTRLVIAVFFLCLALVAEAQSPGIGKSREEPTQNDALFWGFPPDTEVALVVMLFHEGTRVRLREGALTALERSSQEESALTELGLEAAQVTTDLQTAQTLIKEAPFVSRLDRVFKAEESRLDEVARNREPSTGRGRQQADLNLYFGLEVNQGTTFSDSQELVETLNSLASVKTAYAKPPARPAWCKGDHTICKPDPTPNFEVPISELCAPGQGYLNDAPGGINARWAWNVETGGGDGTGVKVADVEGGYTVGHEDFPAQLTLACVPDPDDPNKPCPNCEDGAFHGDATLGVIAGRNNMKGVTGIAHGADIYFVSAGCDTEDVPQNSADAIRVAADTVGEGGVVLIEFHRLGPFNNSPSKLETDKIDYIAIEYWQDDWDAIDYATHDVGAVVIEPAGNGYSWLDDPVYDDLDDGFPRFDRTLNDSGAIMVASSTVVEPVEWGGLVDGATPTRHSNWGSRIDVHGWGDRVASTGSGVGRVLWAACDPDDDEKRLDTTVYTPDFGGTSSASAIVAGAAASLQGMQIALHPGEFLTSEQIRKIFACSGSPQAEEADPQRIKKIGPLPDLREAYKYIVDPDLDFLLPDDPPEAHDDHYFVRINSQGIRITEQELISNDFDPDCDEIKFNDIEDPPTYGSLVEFDDDPPRWIYTPRSTPPLPTPYTDSFDYSIRAIDNEGNPTGYATATVSLTVSHPPVAVDDFYTTQKNTAITIFTRVDTSAEPHSCLMDNDSDDDSEFFFDRFENLPTENNLPGPPAHGTVVVTEYPVRDENNVAIGREFNRFTYTPDDDYIGLDSFPYAIHDEHNKTVGTVHITIQNPCCLFFLSCFE